MQTLTARAAARYAVMESRINPDPVTLETRVGGALGLTAEGMSSHLDRLGWRRLSDGRWLRDLAEAPRPIDQALGCAYLAGLTADPSLWDHVLAFNPRGKRVVSLVALYPHAKKTASQVGVGRELSPEGLAEAAGALLYALDKMRPRVPWGKVPPVRAHLEALARAALPPADPAVLIDSPIPASYLVAHGTAAE